GIEVAVGMGNECPGKPEHTRIPFKRALRQFGQLSVKAGRQIVADLPDLFLDHMVVVEQPFGGGLYATATFQLSRAGAIGRQQYRGIVIQPSLEWQHARRPGRNKLFLGKTARMLCESLYAKEFMSDRRFIFPGRR